MQFGNIFKLGIQKDCSFNNIVHSQTKSTCSDPVKSNKQYNQMSELQIGFKRYSRSIGAKQQRKFIIDPTDSQQKSIGQQTIIGILQGEIQKQQIIINGIQKEINRYKMQVQTCEQQRKKLQKKIKQIQTNFAQIKKISETIFKKINDSEQIIMQLSCKLVDLRQNVQTQKLKCKDDSVLPTHILKILIDIKQLQSDCALQKDTKRQLEENQMRNDQQRESFKQVWKQVHNKMKNVDQKIEKFQQDLKNKSKLLQQNKRKLEEKRNQLNSYRQNPYIQRVEDSLGSKKSTKK